MYKEDYMKITLKDRLSVNRALKKGNTNIFAPSLLNDFENELCKSIKTKYACIMPNCTSSIFTAINALRLKENDEIIIPNLTHSSTLYPIILSNLKFKTYDFCENSYDADINQLESLITKKTKAIMICYLHGYPINTMEIYKLCKKHNLALIEDSAQGFKVKIKNKYAGTIGEFGCYSFGESKLLRIGEGGALVSNNRDYSNIINKIRHVGEIWKTNGNNTVTTLPKYYDLIKDGLDYEGTAFNLRVMPFAYAYGINRLNNIDKLVKSRQKKLSIYYKMLKDRVKFIKNIEYGIDNTAPFSAWILLDKNIDINKIISACYTYGIPIGKFKYPVVSDMQYFKKYSNNVKYNYKNSKDIESRSLFLPIYENLSYKDVKNIANDFLEILEKYKNNPKDKIFNLNNLKKQIKYFNGFYIK